jgi:hypothetical protein
MAGQPLAVASGGVSLTSATEKTVIQITAAANVRVNVTGVEVGFAGTSGTDGPVQVRLIRTTTSGTAGSAPTAVKLKAGTDETVQTAAGINYSAEGSNGDVVAEWRVHPQSGMTVFFPLGQYIEVPGGGRLALKCNAPQNQTANCTLYFEE